MFPCPKPPLKVNDSFNCKTVHDSYSEYDRTVCSNVLSSALVLYMSNGSDVNTIVSCIIFIIYFAVCALTKRNKLKRCYDKLIISKIFSKFRIRNF